jgi:hypothetical protein
LGSSPSVDGVSGGRTWTDTLLLTDNLLL